MFSKRKSEKGNIALLTVLAVSTLFAFSSLVIDLGLLYVTKAQLTNLADAAALAGVQDLPADPQQAVADATLYARQNGLDTDTLDIQAVDNNTGVTVKAMRRVDLLFARLWGMETADVQASAEAKIEVIQSAAGVVPFGVVQQNFVYGQSYTLKAGAGGGYNGNYGGLALGGNGANVYRNNIEYGYDGNLSIGDSVSTEPGNMSGPTSQGVAYRVGLDPDATFDTVKRSSPRIVIVPVIDSLSGNGRTEVEIVGFAAFFLEGAGGQGNQNYVTGEFLQMVMPGDVTTSSTGFGLYGAKLVQ
ncbi:Hypothetical protein LUCI_1849 [Lucifera butyrica]|uniref:Putative Flp pilus-assembly TadG-like N-terminal domain-containing protein n=1 Tax=Lucifera butyrica TaxID=1351585 RepID=A0A498R8Z8_9FIRM|nr:Tad domain-containing protein [Lucifera butyrica]VBB06613.1 Hypothetical protein LUCI_1849 [Lucifera butyrica]